MLTDRYDLFIFDWDGTLSTTTQIVRSARLLKRRYSLSEINKHKEMYINESESPAEIKAQGDINSFYNFIYGLYSVFYRPKLKKGTFELLEQLRKKGKKIAIFSDSNRHRLLIETRNLGVFQKVDLVLSSDTIKMFKPNPAGLVAIVGKFGIKKSRCIYVGDMAADVFTARFAGISSCAVEDGVDPYSTLKSAKPDYMAKTLSAISKM